MKSLFTTAPMIALLAMASVSCEDPKLVEKRDSQKAEITKLRGEIALIEEKLKSLPPDVTGDLEVARSLANKQKEEIESLEKEVAELNDKREALEAEYEAYQVKYKAN